MGLVQLYGRNRWCPQGSHPGHGHDGEGDLKLEVFRDGDFREPFNISDSDSGGILTNESLNADVIAGETIYVRVSPSFGGGPRVSYRVASGLIRN